MYVVSHQDGSRNRPRAAVVAAHASERFPAATLEDWVTFADQVSVVAVVDEAETAPGSDVATDGDYVLRNLTLRVQDTPWRRSDAPSAPETLTVKTWGWIESNGQRSMHLASNAPRLEVGQRYLTPLVRPTDGWTPLADASILKLSGDTTTDEVATGEPHGIAASLQGKSVQDIAKARSSGPAPRLLLSCSSTRTPAYGPVLTARLLRLRSSK